jgi:hypothetical protein
MVRFVLIASAKTTGYISVRCAMHPFEQRVEKEIKKLEKEVRYGKATDGEIRRLAAFKEMLKCFRVNDKQDQECAHQ